MIVVLELGPRFTIDINKVIDLRWFAWLSELSTMAAAAKQLAAIRQDAIPRSRRPARAIELPDRAVSPHEPPVVRPTATRRGVHARVCSR
ncbi:MAG TPA: hypothetical protein VGD37_02765 [Kofleriaceae bacterium]